MDSYPVIPGYASRAAKIFFTVCVHNTDFIAFGSQSMTFNIHQEYAKLTISMGIQNGFNSTGMKDLLKLK